MKEGWVMGTARLASCSLQEFRGEMGLRVGNMGEQEGLEGIKTKRGSP